MLVIRAYGPLNFHGVRITPKQRFLDSIRGESIAGNLLNAHVHCAFALSFMRAANGARPSARRRKFAGCVAATDIDPARVKRLVIRAPTERILPPRC
jgi:hypothetical protein